MLLNIPQVISEIEQEINAIHLPAHPANLYDPIRYLMKLGGKRIRPLLVVLGSYLVSGEYKNSLKTATAVEVFHNFTLMHDDIMDNAPLRRGHLTVHEKWNRNIAILSGDVMLVKVYELLSSLPPTTLPAVLKLFNECAIKVCEGQQLDMDFEKRETITEAEYLEMIALKTAVLLGFSLQVGALLGGATHETAQKLYDFGVNIGIGFQLKDDLLDVFGETEKVGKQKGGDIVANKKTFLLIKAIELAHGELRSSLDYWIEKKDFVVEEKVNAITEIYKQLSIQEITLQKMNEFFARAFQLLNSIELPEERKELLRQFTQQLIEREK